MKVKLKHETLYVELPLQTPKLSASGKTKVVATTRGQVNTGLQYKGEDLLFNANAYIANSGTQKKKHNRPKDETEGDQDLIDGF